MALWRANNYRKNEMNPENNQRNAVAVRWDRTRDVRKHDEIFTASLNSIQSSRIIVFTTRRYTKQIALFYYVASLVKAIQPTSYKNKQSDLIPVTAV